MARVCIVGAGAVGGYVGAHLAKAGIDPVLVDAWPEHVEAMRERGLTVTGIRLAMVSALGIATTGVFIGAGGLGMLIWRGIQTRNMNMMLSGAIPVCALALLFEYAIGLAEKKITKRKSK